MKVTTMMELSFLDELPFKVRPLECVLLLVSDFLHELCEVQNHVRVVLYLYLGHIGAHRGPRDGGHTDH